jgi:hypothetical protein
MRVWNLQSREFPHAFGSHHHVNLEAILEQVWMKTLRRSMGCMPGAGILFIIKSTQNSGNVTRRLYHCAHLGSWVIEVDCVGRQARSCSYIQMSTCNQKNEGKTNNVGWMLYSVYVVLGVCCTWYMLYLVSTHDHNMER